MAGMEQLEIHSKVRTPWDRLRIFPEMSDIVETVVHCPLG
jgi:hypothetical protein